MAHEIDYEILGDDLQAVVITLDPGEVVQAEAGAMLYMDEAIRMDTGADGGLAGGLKRIFTGESFFITSFLHAGPAGRAKVAFAAPFPGKIVPLDLRQLGGTMLCQKDAFLCAAKGTDISIALTKRLGAGLFGGEGFILQKLTGDGLCFAHAGGALIAKDLAPGETVRVDTGCLVAFQPTVEYDIGFVGGFTNALFGGEGLFLATLRGPGRVYLQTLPFSRLADRLKAAISVNREEHRGVAGLGGGLLKNIISGK
ncbi:MAG: TIGR00266 family protein [Krumholzibacteria bacterium]|nr:TIGR00266 family protein [Candidatus Krumholzibacteria bacterium]